MLQRLPIAVAQVKTGQNLIDEIIQVIYYLYWTKKVTKKV